MRAILLEAGLLLECGDEALEHNVYIKNCTNIELDSNGINRSPTEAFTDILPDIKMCQT
jgi:hypothetical protein